MRPPDRTSLRFTLSADDPARVLIGPDATIAMADLVTRSSLGGRIRDLAGRSVLVATNDQLATALALIELDGVASRLTLCPSDVKPEHLPALIEDAAIDAVIEDAQAGPQPAFAALDRVVCRPALAAEDIPPAGCTTEWVLLTSGTTGRPKMVVHSLESLTGAIAARTPDSSLIWGTFYDIRRYGGLQVFFRAVLGARAFVMSQPDAPVADYLARLGRHGATHLLGTPSHWRRVLMSPAAKLIAPKYVRLSGEIADQAILDSLKRAYPGAAVSHAYASTEAGVGFEVTDGREGFSAAFVEAGTGAVDMKVADGSLRVRSSRTASQYTASNLDALRDEDGFVDTGDIVELRGDRYHFVGRRGGIINIGGLKVHPEEVEAVINRHPAVRMSIVRARKNPVVGSVIVAEIVPTEDAIAQQRTAAEIQDSVLQACRDALPRHKVPVSVRVVPALDMSAAGKLVRAHA